MASKKRHSRSSRRSGSTKLYVGSTKLYLRPSSMGWYIEHGHRDRPTIVAGHLTRTAASEWLRSRGLSATTRRGLGRFL